VTAQPEREEHMGGKDIRSLAMIGVHKDPATPLVFRAKTRQAMVEALLTHRSHSEAGYRLSWDVRPGEFDGSGHGGGEAVHVAFDDRWRRYLDATPDLPRLARDDALAAYRDGTWDVDAGAHRGTARFDTMGEDDGELCLCEWDLGPREGVVDMRFRDVHHFGKWLDGLPDAQVSGLYRLVTVADHELSEPGKDLAWQYNARRAALELEWVAQAAGRARDTGT
jgi:hypothetical protein